MPEKGKRNPGHNELSPWVCYPGSVGFEVTALNIVRNRFRRIACRKLLRLPRIKEICSKKVASVVCHRPPIRHHSLPQHSRIGLILPEVSGAKVTAKQAGTDDEDGQRR